ncbi:cellulose-binding domain-containing protein [Glycomyces sp. L485]|uniref:cellulose binding domain-containing protein n=1 Tax=Glycomyces sp. L485 TaxID=2909235 RepID=UPI001F4B9883|nr:cellulose binding domain-containing protein [Glycomyces sp. L485]MCH7232699.1 cellulose-binding domain-containing protein [Glycomyces sp. L485]
MRAWKDRPTLLRGRLHGRLFKALGAIAAAAVLIAVWQFITVLGDDEPDLPDWNDIDLLTEGAPGISPDAESDVPNSDGASPTPTATPDTPSSEPSEAASDEPSADAEPNEPAPPASRCSAELTLEGGWGDTISVGVDVTNTGEETIEGWEIDLAVEGVEITATWGIEHVEDDRYRNVLFNGTLGPGEHAGPSFQAEAEDDHVLPGTVPCSVTAP